MTILGRQAILDYLASGAIVCIPAPQQVEGVHIDVRLGEWQWERSDEKTGVPTDMPIPSLWTPKRWSADEYEYMPFSPRSFYLCHTAEFIGTTVPDLLPVLHCRSTFARWGLTAHWGGAGWGDPGFCSRWTLEVYNATNQTIYVPIGARIGCVSFERVEGNDTLYTGRYNAQAWSPQDMLPKLIDRS